MGLSETQAVRCSRRDLHQSSRLEGSGMWDLDSSYRVNLRIRRQMDIKRLTLTCDKRVIIITLGRGLVLSLF